MSQKYVIVHFIDVANVPNEFIASAWLLHVTLLPKFRVSSLAELEDDLMVYSKQEEPFHVTVEGEAMFGPDKTVAVSLIKSDKNILNIHSKLLAVATKLGAIFDDPLFNADGFRPHATIQTGSRLQDRQQLNIENFTLVDMYPNNDIRNRKIIKTYTLNG